ncbi:MAG: YbbR-like domain-containing protein [Paludibacteraceae bacterium]|nr:YbbR-like domain-containing protein [Paludibacteraceae bacterium]
MQSPVSRIKWRDVLTFMLFLTLATILWYGHAMQSVRNTRVPVLIQYTGKNGNIGLESPGLPDTVMIEVRDAGARLNAYHREPLRLTIDLRQYIHGEKGTIYVPSDALRRSITDILQGTSRLIETTPEEISCPYFTEQEKSVTVAFRGELKPASEYQPAEKPVLSPGKTRLYGQEKDLRAIDTVYTQPVMLDNLTDTVVLRVALDIPAQLRAENDSVNLQIVTERFTEKKFAVPLKVKGTPEGCRILLFPHEVDVYARVAMKHFSEVHASDIKAECVYSPDRTDKLDVELHYNNPYITAAWSYPGVVEFIIEQ